MSASVGFLRPPPVMPVVGLPQRRRQGSATAGDGSPRTDAPAADPGTLARQLVGEIANKVDALCVLLVHQPACLPDYVPEMLLANVTQKIHSAMLDHEYPPVKLGRLVDVTV